MTDTQIAEIARAERLEYFRKWRAANKDKVKEANRKYWERNNSLWLSVLYGITASDDQIVTARCRRSAMWAASLTGLGTASALVWSGALAFYLGVRMSADILTPALSRSLTAV